MTTVSSEIKGNNLKALYEEFATLVEIKFEKFIESICPPPTIDDYTPKAKPVPPCYLPTRKEHIANILTHGVMVPLSVIGTLILLCKSPNEWYVLCAIVYGISLICLYVTSTAFHIVFYAQGNTRLKQKLQLLDRSVIYVFIGASYFPWIMMFYYQEMVIRHFRWLIWICAAFGVCFEMNFGRRWPILGILFYVSYGVIPGIIIHNQINFPGFFELKVSGAIYVLGVIFFKLDGHLSYSHAIWHSFVIFASVLHYYAVYCYLYTDEYMIKAANGGDHKYEPFYYVYERHSFPKEYSWKEILEIFRNAA